MLLGQLGLHCLHLGDLGRVRNVPIRLREAQEMILIVQLEGIFGLGCSIPIHLNRIESHVHCIGEVVNKSIQSIAIRTVENKNDE